MSLKRLINFQLLGIVVIGQAALVSAQEFEISQDISIVSDAESDKEKPKVIDGPYKYPWNKNCEITCQYESTPLEGEYLSCVISFTDPNIKTKLHKDGACSPNDFLCSLEVMARVYEEAASWCGEFTG